jgi:tRNA (mo5U34)-methyltransferase
MDLQAILNERQKWMGWKKIAPLREALNTLQEGSWHVDLSDCVKIDGNYEDKEHIYNVAKLMMPWRKGPFEILDTFIDTEWKSNIKYNLLRKHFNLKDKKSCRYRMQQRLLPF